MNRYINTIVIMSIMTLLVGTAVGQDVGIGKTVFDTKCGTCHATGVMGAPSIAVLSKTNPDNIRQIVRQGSGKMPAFNDTDLTDNDLANVIAYLGSTSTGSQGLNSTTTISTNMTATPYGSESYGNATPSEANESYGNATPSETNEYGNATSGTTIPRQTVSLPIETPADNSVSTPIAPATTTSAPKSPGFGIILGIVGILLIYRLKSR